MPGSGLPHAGVLTRLGPSAIDGVGVFALYAIAKDTVLFVHDQEEIQWVAAELVDQAHLDERELAFYRDFAIRREGMLGCPRSFDLLTPGWYVNQPIAGEAANIHALPDFTLIAARDIVAGEELTLDYDGLNEGKVWDGT